MSVGDCARQHAGTLAPPRTSWTARDLLAATFPEPRWAVPGVLAEGLNLLVGAPKLGKSWFALGAAAAVAAGGRAFGRVKVDQGAALYLALEDPPRRLQERLRIVLEDGGVPADLHFETSWPAIPGDGADQLHEWLAGHPACRLVVVDVLAKVRPQGDERSSRYDADYAAVGALKAIADRHAVAMVLLHHTRKQAADDFLDTVSGTHGLAGAADAVLVMQRARNSADAVLHVTGRDVEEAEHAMRLDATRGAWTLLDGPASDYDLADTRRRVLDLIRRDGPMRPKAIADALDIKHDTAKQTVRRMVEADQLDTDGNGLYLAPTPSPQSPLSLLPGDSSDRSDRGTGEADNDAA